ncbi:uncharacterized protein LOC119188845 [Manduca sexta]|uniref:uncharacterized protein LOC119188845 n=1 Tax=Manduca sexta TaxID=7130 RepID=UPI00188EFC4F|nr:uncharacterized protein LOC119188845 [Manduca sexta]
MQRSELDANPSGNVAMNKLNEQVEENALSSASYEESGSINDIAEIDLSLLEKMEKAVKRTREDEDFNISQKSKKVDKDTSNSPNTSYEDNANQAFDKEEDILSIAFRRRLKYFKTEIGVEKYTMTYKIEEIDLLSNVKLVLSESFINDIRDDFIDLVEGFTKCDNFYKVNLTAHTEFVHNFVNMSCNYDIQSYNSTIYKENDIESSFITLRNNLRDRIASEEKEIGWTLNRIKSITMSINILNSLMSLGANLPDGEQHKCP